MRIKECSHYDAIGCSSLPCTRRNEGEVDTVHNVQCKNAVAWRLASHADPNGTQAQKQHSTSTCGLQQIHEGETCRNTHKHKYTGERWNPVAILQSKSSPQYLAKDGVAIEDGRKREEEIDESYGGHEGIANDEDAEPDFLFLLNIPIILHRVLER